MYVVWKISANSCQLVTIKNLHFPNPNLILIVTFDVNFNDLNIYVSCKLDYINETMDNGTN